MSTCTWIDCREDGAHERRARDGRVWAVLCHGHDIELSEALHNGLPAQICSSWVKAQGGAKKAAERM